MRWAAKKRGDKNQGRIKTNSLPDNFKLINQEPKGTDNRNYSSEIFFLYILRYSDGVIVVCCMNCLLKWDMLL